ncbi:hypothetical protein [Novosphingobium sp. M1R2S20]|uniref:Superfamily III holin-X n=1 Tax=Novosphingobium rhizovicinum TaxID=3228928 RepID=A0ABV3RDI5_9SPHN
MSPEPLKPSAIDKAPVDIDIDGNGEIDELEAAYERLGSMTEALANAEAELERIRQETSIDRVKARMLEPYVNKVFRFVAWYCVAVGIVLVACGLQVGFALPETILAIIAGSTAVSVIGLIGLVITGLFGGKKA